MNQCRLAKTHAPGLLLLAVFFATSFALNAQGPDREVSIITGHLEQSDNQGALELSKHALLLHPRSCPLLTLKAISESSLNQKESALASFYRALEICPSYLPALKGAAELEYSQKNPRAIQLLNRILSADPKNLTAHAMLAVAYRMAENCQSALPEFEASKTLFSSHPEFAQEYGYCLLHEGNYRGALQEFTDLLATQPSQAIRLNVALLQWKTGAADKALATLDPLISQKNVPALTLASAITEEQGDTPRSVEYLRSAISTDPKNIDNYVDFAVISFRHKSFQAGIDMLNVGIALLPESAELLVARGILEIQLGENEKAIADLRSAHRRAPKLSVVSDALGMMRTQNHENSGALDFFRSEARQHPNDAFLQFLLAEQLSAVSDGNSREMRSAIAAAKMAVHLDPSYTAAHDLLAQLYVRSGQWNLATQEARIASIQNPNDESAVYQEIMARRHSGDPNAIKDLVARLQTIRQENLKKRQMIDRYKLETENVPH